MSMVCSRVFRSALVPRRVHLMHRAPPEALVPRLGRILPICIPGESTIERSEIASILTMFIFIRRVSDQCSSEILVVLSHLKRIYAGDFHVR